MSPFQAILRELVERVPGAEGAVFADWEGEAVDEFVRKTAVEIKLVGAHFGVVLFLIEERLREQAGIGRAEELLIEAEHALTLVRRVNDFYYVVLQGSREVHLGTARRELDRGVIGLRQEM